jgi:rsbT co-antagonist protein RsbR
MAPHKVYTFADLEPFDALSTLVWVVDLERGARWWVNLACLPLWNTASRDELLARSIDPPSETSRIRLEALRRRFEAGQRSIYPDGAPPFAAECRSSGIHIAERRDGPARLAMLIEGRLLGPEEQDPLERRSVEALRYLGELVSFYSETGEAVMRNPAAVRVLGDVGPDHRFAGDFVDPAQAADARARLAAREPFRGDTCIRTLAGERWFDTEARPVLDPVTGKPGVLVTQRDIAERRAHVAALEHNHRRLAEQAEALRTLSAPVIRVGDGVLALPLIGALDGERLDAALAALLAQTGREKLVRVVLDLTGAAAVDDAVASGLLRTIRVLRLQGVAVAISGIRPELAQTIVAAGLDLAGVPCFQSLEHALRLK